MATTTTATTTTTTKRKRKNEGEEEEEEEEEQHRRCAKPCNIAETTWVLGSRALAIHMLRHFQPMLGLRGVILGLYVDHVAPSCGWHAMSKAITSQLQVVYKFRLV